MHVTSLDECLRHYRANKKTIIIVGTVFEVEIGTKEITLGRRDLGGGDTKVAIFNIRSVKINNTESLSPATYGDGWERADAATTNTTGETTITYPVSVQFLRHQHHILSMMKHSDWWLHSQWIKRPAGRSLH